MELKVKLLEDDYYNFNKAVVYGTLKRKYAKKLIIFGAVLGGLFIFVLLSLLLLNDNSKSVANPIEQSASGSFQSGSIVFLIFISVFVYSLLTGVKKSSKKVFQSNKLLQSEQIYKFTEEGFEIQSESGFGKIGWDKIYRIEKYKVGISMFISTNQAYIIPKRCFQSDEELKLFESLVNEAIKQFDIGKKI